MSEPPPPETRNIPERNLALVVLLLVVTLGFYTFYLLYQWAHEVNAALGHEKHQPLVVLLVSLLTCLIGGIVYECVFAYDIAAAATSKGVSRRMVNLPTWVILCNCVGLIVSFIPFGFVVGFVLGVLASVLVQVELNKLARA